MSAALDHSPPASPAAELQAEFTKLMRSRIRLAPVHTLRASSIGHECERYLVYEQTAHEQRQPHGEGLQAIFELGKELEGYTVRLLEDMGFRVENRNRDFHDREHALTGHLDGRLARDSWAKSLPMEVKGLNPFTSDTIRTVRDIKESRTWWVRKYYAQLQSYLHLDNDPIGVFVLLNKVTGQLHFIDCPRDDDFIREMLAKAKRVKEAVLANLLPDRHQSPECARCPFVHVCLPDQAFGEGVQILDMPELIAALDRREANRDARSEYEAADKLVKELLPEKAGELLVGDYAVISKEVSRKAYEVKAGSYIKREIRRLAPFNQVLEQSSLSRIP